MVERRVCTFCGVEIEPGTGRMYIKKDGVVYNFCSSKCFKNLVVLGRVPRRTTWTRYYEREKQVRMKGLPGTPQPARARKVKTGEEGPRPEAKPDEGAGEKGEAKEPEKPRPVKREAKKPSPRKPESEKKERSEPAQKEAAKG